MVPEGKDKNTFGRTSYDWKPGVHFFKLNHGGMGCKFHGAETSVSFCWIVRNIYVRFDISSPKCFVDQFTYTVPSHSSGQLNAFFDTLQPWWGLQFGVMLRKLRVLRDFCA